jgi:hypothetical protein
LSSFVHHLYREKQLGFENPADLIFLKTGLPQSADQGTHMLRGLVDTLYLRIAAPSSRYESAGTLPEFQKSLVLEFGVCLHHGRRTNDKLLGKGTNPWELVARPQSAMLHGMPNLLHELQIQGLARV